MAQHGRHPFFRLRFASARHRTSRTPRARAVPDLSPRTCVRPAAAHGSEPPGGPLLCARLIHRATALTPVPSVLLLALVPRGKTTVPVEPQNRRAFEREPGDANATIVRAAAGAPHELRGYLHDVSPRGVALLLRTPLELGEVVTITLRKPSTQVQVEISGLVRHVNRLQDGAYRIGLSLTRGLTPAGLNDLRRTLDGVWRARPRASQPGQQDRLATARILDAKIRADQYPAVERRIQDRRSKPPVG